MLRIKVDRRAELAEGIIKDLVKKDFTLFNSEIREIYASTGLTNKHQPANFRRLKLGSLDFGGGSKLYFKMGRMLNGSEIKQAYQRRNQRSVRRKESKLLTELELNILNLMKEGFSGSRTIAEITGKSRWTIRNRQVSIYSKLGLHSTRERKTSLKIKAILEGIRLGEIEPPKPLGIIDIESTPIAQLGAKNHPEMVESKK